MTRKLIGGVDEMCIDEPADPLLTHCSPDSLMDFSVSSAFPISAFRGISSLCRISPASALHNGDATREDDELSVARPYATSTVG